MLAVQRRVARSELSSEAMLAYGALQQKYNIYQQVVQNNINYYLKEHPGAWLVYESGYKKLFGFSGTADVQDTLWAGLLCALCFSGLFAMERKAAWMRFWQPRRWVGNIPRKQSCGKARSLRQGSLSRNGFAASVADPAGLRSARAAGPGDEHFGVGGCTEMYHAV